MADSPLIFDPATLAPSAADDATALEDLLADTRTDDGADLIIASDPAPPVGRSWLFSSVNQRFVTSGINAHSPIATFGDATLVQWIVKTLQVARGAHPVYSTSYGMEGGPFAVIGHPFTSADYAMLKTAVTSALTFHPRISDVAEFDAFQGPDDEVVQVSFVVVKDDGSALSVQDVEVFA